MKILLSQDRDYAESLTGRMNVTLLSVRAFTFVFTSQLLPFSYFNYLVHSAVSSLFNLKYIVSHALWTCFNVLSYSCLFTSINFTYTWLSYQQQAYFMTPKAFVMICNNIDCFAYSFNSYNYRLPDIRWCNFWFSTLPYSSFFEIASFFSNCYIYRQHSHLVFILKRDVTHLLRSRMYFWLLNLLPASLSFVQLGLNPNLNWHSFFLANRWLF